MFIINFLKINIKKNLQLTDKNIISKKNKREKKTQYTSLQ